MASLPPLSQLAGNHGPLFDGLWETLDSRGGGHIDAAAAAAFLKKSQLREPVLHKIWEMSDAGGKGYLDKQGFFMALRLVAMCQSGKEPSVANMALSDPPPNFVGVSASSVTKNKWTIEPDDQLRYQQMFQSLQPIGGKVTGEKAKPIMMASKLPLDALGKIWNLSDINKDGQLDEHGFAVAMRLITLCQAGETLPATLPSSLLPAGRTSGVLPSSSSPLHPAPVTSMLRSQSPKPASPGGVKSSLPVEWIITPEIKAKYDTYFEGIDKNHEGIVSGEQARGLFMASNLPQNILAGIWGLCDIQKNGKLNAEQFALAMFLIAEKVRGKEVPKELTANMIPPSLRKQQTVAPPTPSAATPTTSAPTSSSVTSLLPMSTPLFSSITALSAPPTSSLSGTSTTSVTASSAFGFGDFGADSGFSSDFSAIKDLDHIANEIDSIQKEKNKLQEDIRQKQELIQQRKGEIETLQDDLEVYSKQREELEKEKAQAQSQLEQLDSERTKGEGQLSELKQKCQEEQEEIARLKSQLTQQESSKRAQGEELERLQEQLEGLRKEEREYKAKVEAATAELEKFQKANQNIQNEMSQMRQKIDSLKEEQQALSNALPLYPPVSTPGSTPGSSVVNINDVGQLSAELHVPHLGEQDAISARATAGSSSPVSSISGFSTNSHLEEGAAEDASSKEDKQRSDPFASATSSTSTDPFAAFSVAGVGDPFTSAGGAFTGKPSDLSAFDPFGPSDPFKSSAGRVSSGDDLFKTDPFSSTSSAGRTSGGSASGMTTDPFSGQDPFSSDPFAASSDSKDSGQGLWSGPSPFGLDPFGSQQPAHTPTDPFASGDPFGDDPFSPSSMATNPFPTTATTASTAKSSQQWSVPEPLPKPGPNATEDERLAWATRESEREEALRKQRKVSEDEELAKVLRDSLNH